MILGCRNLDNGNAATAQLKAETGADVTALKLDLASFDSVRAFAQQLLDNRDRVDILINNAGVMMCPEGKTVDGYEVHLQTNHLGHFLLTNLLLPRLKDVAPSRIINVSSLAHYACKSEFNDRIFCFLTS